MLNWGWTHLVDHLQVTKGRYLKHKGLPIVGLYGIGYVDKSGDSGRGDYYPTNTEAQQIVTFFHSYANAPYTATLLGGLPLRWASADDGVRDGAMNIFKQFDSILPWTPGSYAGMSEAQKRFANINPIIMAKCGGVIGGTVGSWCDELTGSSNDIIENNGGNVDLAFSVDPVGLLNDALKSNEITSQMVAGLETLSSDVGDALIKLCNDVGCNLSEKDMLCLSDTPISWGFPEALRKCIYMRPTTEDYAQHFLEKKSGNDNYKEDQITFTKGRNIDFMANIFPGFSFYNAMGYDKNQSPRYEGEFLWRQGFNAIKNGARMIYISMFDELDEGTAIMKTAPSTQEIPQNKWYLTLDYDSSQNYIPPDWYMIVTGAVGQELKSRMRDSSSSLSGSIRKQLKCRYLTAYKDANTASCNSLKYDDKYDFKVTLSR